MRASEIRVKRICVNQGLGVYSCKTSDSKKENIFSKQIWKSIETRCSSLKNVLPS